MQETEFPDEDMDLARALSLSKEESFAPTSGLTDQEDMDLELAIAMSMSMQTDTSPS